MPTLNNVFVKRGSKVEHRGQLSIKIISDRIKVDISDGGKR
jgi:hypothetical protein